MQLSTQLNASIKNVIDIVMNDAIHILKVQRKYKDENKFSIFIPTWNNVEYLKLCIKSIRVNSVYKHQIIVHVNEGKDGSLDWVAKQEDVDYTYSEDNIGVCYALNSCRSLAATNYIVYINDDMYVCPEWDKALLDEINTLNTKYFFLSSTLIEPDTQNNCAIDKNYGRDISTFNEEKLLAEYSSLKKKDWQGATWPPNIIHKDIWDLVGGYSIEFSPGLYSDPDFSMKLWKAGVRYFKGVSKSRAYHFGSLSLKRVKKNKGYYMFVSKWGVTQNTFSKNYLRRGEPFTGKTEEPDLSFFATAKNYFKKIKGAFVKY